MRKFILLFLFGLTILAGCASSTTPTTTPTVSTTPSVSTTEGESPCKDTPLAEGCYVPSFLQTLAPTENLEYTLEETFESEFVGQMPGNWLLYSNEEYDPRGVWAKVVEDGTGNRYVNMYSDGLQKPMYPQNAPTPTFIFTSKFNLDEDRAGFASVRLMVPSVSPNSVSAGMSTGAVNIISVTVSSSMSLSVKIGGPFYYYSQNADAGQVISTGITLEHDVWYVFGFSWDASLNLITAVWIEGETVHTLYSGPFHISSRYNATADGEIYVPNVVRVTMPYQSSGYACLDDVFVIRKGE